MPTEDPAGPPAPAAVLWDMDGTLVDSEPQWDVSMEATARDLGGTFSARARAAVLGADIATSVRVLLDDVGHPVTPELVASTTETLLAHTAALFRRGVVWRPGAREALAAVRAAGVPTALVTNSARRLTELVLDGIGREFFDVTVCGDEVAAPKPAPDPYLLAAERLGVAPARCLAFEDSETGARAAHAAGMTVVQVPDLHPTRGAHAHHVAETLLLGATAAGLLPR
jgi:HAD superfamily hydrolase (TIGR01509 family)